jgi:hypothetical protein
MPSDFFTQLGKDVAAELASPSGNYPIDPTQREELSNILRGTLDPHLNTRPPTAKDSAMPNNMPVRGSKQWSATDQAPSGGTSQSITGSSNFDQDPNDSPISGSDCLQFVQMCMAKLQGSDLEEFMSGLTDIVSTTSSDGSNGTLEITHHPNGNGNGNNNGGRSNVPPTGDRSRRTRTARDGVIPSGMDRRIAQDQAFRVRAMNSRNFQQRFPFLKNLDVMR